MDYEKEYKKALERATQLSKQGGTHKYLVCQIFPELAESDDEKIRKELIAFLKHYHTGQGNTVIFDKDWIAWLEKQGEQKPFDYENANIPQKDFAPKVEPKFRNGQWIVWQNKCYKVNCNGCGYELVDQNGLSTSLEYGTVEENAHLWDITKDAKDGDVLSFDNEDSNYHSIGIFKRIARKNEPNGNTYRCYVRYGGFKEKLEIPINGDELHHCGTSAHPATKEQRDKLLKAMADAGYTFDFEKKELKKVEQKHTWSKDDEKMVKCCEIALEAFEKLGKNTQGFPHENYFELDEKIYPSKVNPWLKSLKERVQPQPKREWKQENIDDLNVFEDAMMHIGDSFFGQDAGLNPNDTNAIKEQANLLLELVPSKEWNEEDEEMLRRCISATFDHGYLKECDWLKSLRPQNRWKPTDEQMEAFEHFVRSWGESGTASPYDNNTKLIYSLLQDLKKLREE